MITFFCLKVYFYHLCMLHCIRVEGPIATVKTAIVEVMPLDIY